RADSQSAPRQSRNNAVDQRPTPSTSMSPTAIATAATARRTIPTVPWNSMVGLAIKEVRASRPLSGSTAASRKRLIDSLPRRLFSASSGLPVNAALETVEISVRETIPPIRSIPAKPFPIPVRSARRSTSRTIRVPTAHTIAADTANTAALVHRGWLPKSSSSDNRPIPGAVVRSAARPARQAEPDQGEADQDTGHCRDAGPALEQERRGHDPRAEHDIQEAHGAHDLGHCGDRHHDHDAASDVIAEVEWRLRREDQRRGHEDDSQRSARSQRPGEGHSAEHEIPEEFPR